MLIITILYVINTQHSSRDDLSRLSFHDAQRLIDEYRRDRVKRYKLVFPNLVSKSAEESKSDTLPKRDSSIELKSTKRSGTLLLTSGLANSGKQRLGKTVSESVAPQTMFLKMKGMTNADLNEQVSVILSYV